MNETLPHFLNLDGLVVNVDKILYIRSAGENNSRITFDTNSAENEVFVEGVTPSQLFTLLDKYDAHLRELKTQGLT